jgi:hypothetical protein
MDRFRTCIATNEEDGESAQINVIEERIFILPILRCSCPGGTPCTLNPSNRIAEDQIDRMLCKRSALTEDWAIIQRISGQSSASNTSQNVAGADRKFGAREPMGKDIGPFQK